MMGYEKEYDDIKEIVAYYSDGDDKILLSKAIAILKEYDKGNREVIINWLTDNIPRQDGKYRHKLSVTDIRTAITESGAVAIRPEYIQAERIRCDACGYSYQWTQCSCREWKETKNIYDRCPNCGLDYIDTMNALKTAEGVNGKLPAWYEKLRKRCLAEHPAGSKPHYSAEVDKADDERKKRERVEAMKSDVEAEVRTLTDKKSIDVESENRERLAKRRAEADAAARDLFGRNA